MPLAALAGDLPWIGDLWRFFDDRLSFLERCARSGDATSVRFGPFRVLVLSHPDHVREVFVREAKHFSRGITGAPMRAFLGNGLLLSEGETWKRQRSYVQPLFAVDQLAAWKPAIACAAQALLSRWRDGEARDIHHEMHRLTLDIAARVFLGVASDDGGHLDPALEGILQGDVFQAVIPLGPLRWPLRPSRATREIDALVERQISASIDGRGSPFIAALGAATRDRRELRDQLVTLLFTAEDTTAVSLTWLWHLLSRHPRAESELRGAIAAPGSEATSGKEYLSGALDETLRLYPPVVGQARQAVDDCEIASKPVRRGDLVMFSQWIIHRDARWFDDPTAFRPERWRDGLEDRLHPFAFFPFGGGRRVCVGRSLATMIAMIVVPLIARRYRLVAASEGEPAMHVILSPRPRAGLPMTIHSTGSDARPRR